MVELQAEVLSDIAKSNDFTVMGIMAVIIVVLGWLLVKLYAKYVSAHEKLVKQGLDIVRLEQIEQHQEKTLKKMINILIIQNPENKDMLKGWIDE